MLVSKQKANCYSFGHLCLIIENNWKLKLKNCVEGPGAVLPVIWCTPSTTLLSSISSMLLATDLLPLLSAPTHIRSRFLSECTHRMWVLPAMYNIHMKKVYYCGMNKIRLCALGFVWHFVNRSVCFPSDYTNNIITLLKQMTWPLQSLCTFKECLHTWQITGTVKNWKHN